MELSAGLGKVTRNLLETCVKSAVAPSKPVTDLCNETLYKEKNPAVLTTMVGWWQQNVV